jgi:tetratricopeptide (TPR) repeat protein
MRKLIFQIISGWHHGRGGKYTRKGNFELALKHFRAALEYASRSDNEASIPVEMECIARTLVRLRNYEQAEKYATESLNQYKRLRRRGRIFDESADRVKKLLEVIEKRELV